MITTALTPTIADGELAAVKAGRAKSSKAEGFADLVRSCVDCPKKDSPLDHPAAEAEMTEEEAPSAERSQEETRSLFFSLLFLPAASEEPVGTSSEKGEVDLSGPEEAGPGSSANLPTPSPSLSADEEETVPETSNLPRPLEGKERPHSSVAEESRNGESKAADGLLFSSAGADRKQEALAPSLPEEEGAPLSRPSAAGDGGLSEEGRPATGETASGVSEAQGEPAEESRSERSVPLSPDRSAATVLSPEAGDPLRKLLSGAEVPRKDRTGENAPSRLVGQGVTTDEEALGFEPSRKGDDAEAGTDDGETKPEGVSSGQEKAEGGGKDEGRSSQAPFPADSADRDEGAGPAGSPRAETKEGASRPASDDGQSRPERIQPISDLLPSAEIQRGKAASALSQDFPRRFTTIFPLAEGLSGAASATIRLGRNRADVVVEPPALGRVEIHFRQGGQGIEATLRVDNEGLRQLVQGQIDQLRTALQQAGIVLQGLSVDVRSGGEGPRWAWPERKDPRKGLLDGEDTLEFAIDLEQGLLSWMA